MLDGYIIERQGVSWDERFYKSFSFSGEPVFGEDRRATVFVNKNDANSIRDKIIESSGIYVSVHARSDFYPPPL
jgi:hypothetical protein|tara:strand:- start:3342 stop:3563 length:222 start_codon:yes stop_codon:yes gene_type:complete